MGSNSTVEQPDASAPLAPAAPLDATIRAAFRRSYPGSANQNDRLRWYAFLAGWKAAAKSVEDASGGESNPAPDVGVSSGKNEPKCPACGKSFRCINWMCHGINTGWGGSGVVQGET